MKISKNKRGVSEDAQNRGHGQAPRALVPTTKGEISVFHNTRVNKIPAGKSNASSLDNSLSVKKKFKNCNFSRPF
jgi:hypothetical protein